jgi:hypothetical protein
LKRKKKREEEEEEAILSDGLDYELPRKLLFN